MSATSIASILAGQQKQNAAGGIDPRVLAKILSANSGGGGYVSEAIPGMQVRRALDQADTHDQQFQAAPGLGEWAPLGAVLEGIAGNITRQHDDQSIADAYQGYRDAEQSTYDREQQAAQQQAAAQAAAAEQQYVRGRADKQADAAAADTRWQQRHSQIAGAKMAMEQFRRANPSAESQLALQRNELDMVNIRQQMDARTAEAQAKQDAVAQAATAKQQEEVATTKAQDTLIASMQGLLDPARANAADAVSGAFDSIPQLPTYKPASQSYKADFNALKARLTLDEVTRIKKSGVAGLGNTDADIAVIAAQALQGMDLSNEPEINNAILRRLIEQRGGKPQAGLSPAEEQELERLRRAHPQ